MPFSPFAQFGHLDLTVRPRPYILVCDQILREEQCQRINVKKSDMITNLILIYVNNIFWKLEGRQRKLKFCEDWDLLIFWKKNTNVDLLGYNGWQKRFVNDSMFMNREQIIECVDIVKILNLYIMLSCTLLYHLFWVSIHYLQCIHWLLQFMLLLAPFN